MGDLRFEDVSAEWGLDKRASASARPGRPERGRQPRHRLHELPRGVTLLRNDCDTGHVVNVDLRGTVSNRYGVGAT
jgi:enediyne biosynthesis protein E4